MDHSKFEYVTKQYFLWELLYLNEKRHTKNSCMWAIQYYLPCLVQESTQF